MQDYNVLLTWEAIYDITDIADYIEAEFGQTRADVFLDEMKAEITKLQYDGYIFPKTQILYRNYIIRKKPFPPSLIFYISIEKKQEIHVLRILREERDWQSILSYPHNYTYPV